MASRLHICPQCGQSYWADRRHDCPTALRRSRGVPEGPSDRIIRYSAIGTAIGGTLGFGAALSRLWGPDLGLLGFQIFLLAWGGGMIGSIVARPLPLIRGVAVGSALAVLYLVGMFLGGFIGLYIAAELERWYYRDLIQGPIDWINISIVSVLGWIGATLAVLAPVGWMRQFRRGRFRLED